MSKMLKAAKEYAKKGFSVLPMINKRPLIKFADQPPITQKDIEEIWSKYPNAGIALKTTDFFVVDIDKNHADGVDGFKSLEKYNHWDYFPYTLIQKTKHGGEQLFYKKPKNCEIKQKIGWFKGVDIKAHKNNYVVVAPSPGYKWFKYPMAVAPKKLIKAINNSSNASNNKKSLLGNNKADTALLEKAVKGLGENGQRNSNLTSFIGSLLVRNIGSEEAYELARLANAHTSEPLPLKEVDRTFDSIVNREIKRREAS